MVLCVCELIRRYRNSRSLCLFFFSSLLFLLFLKNKSQKFCSPVETLWKASFHRRCHGDRGEMEGRAQLGWVMAAGRCLCMCTWSVCVYACVCVYVCVSEQESAAVIGEEEPCAGRTLKLIKEGDRVIIHYGPLERRTLKSLLLINSETRLQINNNIKKETRSGSANTAWMWFKPF